MSQAIYDDVKSICEAFARDAEALGAAGSQVSPYQLGHFMDTLFEKLYDPRTERAAIYTVTYSNL